MKYSLNFLFNEIVLLLLYHTKDNRVNLLLKIKGFQPNWTKAKRKRDEPRPVCQCARERPSVKRHGGSINGQQIIATALAGCSLLTFSLLT